MAVRDEYVTSKIANNIPAPAAQAGGADLKAFFATFELAAADDDASILRLFKAVPGDLIIHTILIGCDTITAGTDFDLGFYKTDLGAVIDKDNLMDGQTLATASNMALNGLGAVDIADRGKRIFELAGHTVANKEKKGYDIALTANTIGSAAGTVSVLMLAYQG